MLLIKLKCQVANNTVQILELLAYLLNCQSVSLIHIPKK
jgi:hypothetical protein